MIRLATVEDLDDIIEIGLSRYPEFHVENTRRWAEQAISNPNMLFVRSDNGFGVAGLTSFFYEPNVKRATMMYLCTREHSRMEGYRILKMMIQWAKILGATSFHFGEETGIDLSPLAKRLGAKVDRPSYRIEF